MDISSFIAKMPADVRIKTELEARTQGISLEHLLAGRLSGLSDSELEAVTGGSGEPPTKVDCFSR